MEDQYAAVTCDKKANAAASRVRATEQAQNFKEQGNDNFKSKKYKEAIAFYTQGLGNLAPELREETKRTLWCNRAMCQLELGMEARL